VDYASPERPSALNSEETIALRGGKKGPSLGEDGPKMLVCPGRRKRLEP
jgi:hypothetical protein